MICFGCVFGITTILGYLMPKTFYTHILNIYDFLWLGFMAYQPLKINLCQNFFINICQNIYD